MRFSLRAGFAAMTLFGFGLGMVVEHGQLGVAFLLPPTLLLAGAAYLWRKGLRTTSIGCVAAYLLLWGGTEIWGMVKFEAEMQQRLMSHGRERFGPYHRFSSDPSRSEKRPRPKAPWYYLGRAHSPCPLLLYVDYGMMCGPACGFGERSYFVWFGGWQWVTGAPYWMS